MTKAPVILKDLSPAARYVLATKLQIAYYGGDTTYSLAAEYGLSVHTIWRLLKTVDTTMRPTGPRKEKGTRK